MSNLTLEELKPFFNEAISKEQSVSTLWMKLNQVFNKDAVVPKYSEPEVMEDPANPDNVCIGCE